MPATPLKKFETEVSRLKFLCVAATHSFRQSADALVRDIKSGVLNPHNPIQLLSGSSDRRDAESNAFVLLHRMNSQFPRYLREIVFVRVISALEVFLLDVIRDMFLVQRDLFHIDQRLELSYGELLSVESVTQLWSKLINRELRKLQNQGFKEVVKFFRVRLGIDFSHSGIPLSTVEEYHERRHIMVHRLGRTDEEYRRRYNTLHKTVNVSESYLFDCVANLLSLAAWVSGASQTRLLERSRGEVPAQAECQMRVIVEVLSESAVTVLSRDFHYSVDDRICRLGEILVSHEIDGLIHELVIGGEQTKVGAYVKVLKSLQGQRQLVIRERNTLRYRRSPRCNLPPELVERIWKSLPPRPWPKDLHKTVATEFNVSKTQAWAAIGLFLQDKGRLHADGP